MGSQSAVFDRLRPVCVQLTKEHSRDNILKLSKALLGVDRACMQELQEYILFPLRIILKQEKKYSDDLYTDVYNSMERILASTRISHWEMFQDLFNTAFVKLGDPRQQGKVSSLSEELKLSIIGMLKVLVRNSDYSIVQNLLAVWSLPALGHAVSVLLSIAEHEKSRSLKIAALECLLGICQEDKKYCTRVKTTLGDTLSSFLPGISISMCHIITGDTKQGQNVIKTALKVLTCVVSLVLSDHLVAESQSKQQKATCNAPTNEKLASLVIKRNPDWIKSTGSKLKVIVGQVIKVRSHSSMKVRLALGEWAGVLLLHCTKSLSESVPLLLEALVGMIADDYPAVAAISRRNLEVFCQTHQGAQCRPLVEMLEENLHSLCLSLPRQIHTADEEEKLPVISLLSGYLTLLGPNIKGVLMSTSHLKRLVMSLVQVLEVDCSDVKIVEERTTMVGHGASVIDPGAIPDILQPRKHFKHFHSNKIFTEIAYICRILGFYGKLTLLIDCLIDVFHESSIHRLQAVIMINNIIMGVRGTEDDSHSTDKMSEHCTETELDITIGMLIEEYLSPTNMDLITRVDLSDPELSPECRLKAINILASDNSVNNYNRNIIQICLLLEGLGCFAKVLKTSYLPYLMHTLYVLLEKLGDDTAYISSQAYLSLCDTCTACNYRSIDELLRDNADYLVNTISLRLRHFHCKEKSPLVLKVMLQYSSPDLLPLIDDTVHEILDSLDDHHERDAALFMGVLCELTKAIQRWFPGNKNTDWPSKNLERAESVHFPQQMSALDLSAFIADYCRQKKIAEGDDIADLSDLPDSGDKGSNSVTEGDDIESNVEDTDKTKTVPKHVQIVKEVLMRCKHMLSSHNPRLKLVTLETISYGCMALQCYQNELLPLIHEVWAPFSLRFSDEEKLVTKKALNVLRVMGEVSGDFIRQRTVKDVIPRLTQFLMQQALISNHAGHAYIYTMNYKLQHTILSELGTICHEIRVDGNDLDKVMSACVLYLSARQPKMLQQVAMDTCKHFIQTDSDTMWLKLNGLSCVADYCHHDPNFLHVKFNSSEGHNEFTDNVKKLFDSSTELQNGAANHTSFVSG